MKRTLYFLHKYLPCIPAFALIVVIVYLAKATIYLKQIPGVEISPPICYLDRIWGPGMHSLYLTCNSLLTIAFFATLAWLVITATAAIAYKSHFKLNRGSVAVSVLCSAMWPIFLLPAITGLAVIFFIKKIKSSVKSVAISILLFSMGAVCYIYIDSIFWWFFG